MSPRRRPGGPRRRLDASYRKLKPRPGSAGEGVAAHQLGRVHAATIELVSSDGYEALTVAAVIGRAGVSKRAFYELFDGKDECFLATYDMIVREMARRVLEAQASSADWRERLRRTFATLSREIADHPNAAHLALVDIYVELPDAMDRVRHTVGLLETLLERTFSLAGDDLPLPPPIYRAIVGAAGALARARLTAGATVEFREEVEGLMDWALSLRAPEAEAAFSAPVPPVPALPQVVDPGIEQLGAEPSECEAVLAVAAEIAACEDYSAVTARRVAMKLDLPKKRVAPLLPGREVCQLAALDSHGNRAIAEVRAAFSAQADWPTSIGSGLLALCARLDADQTFARMALVDVFESGLPATLWRTEKLRGLAALVRSTAPPEMRPTRLQAEASVAGAWAVLASAAREGSIGELRALAPGLTYILVAPVIGAEAAGIAILGSPTPVERASVAPARWSEREKEPVPGC